jgi:phage terminase large subunit-like protein
MAISSAMARAKARKQSTSAPDAATAYAHSVVDGKTVAGPYVRYACRRHLEDLKKGAARGLSWDVEAAERAIGFYRDVLRLNGGEFEGKAYELLPWQSFIVGSVFGWKTSDGFRRFRVVYVETAKGSGKSPLAAGVGLYGLVADGEARAEIYAAATKKDQAQILFRDAVAMVDQSPALAKRITKSGVGENVWNLAYRQTGSWFRPISADDGQSGPRPHITLGDEIHEHKNGYIVEMAKAGQKSRRQPLLFMITNSGASRTSICWEYHDYGIKVASGAISNDSFFAYVCAVDKKDDPLKDEKCWPKVNPSLAYGLPTLRYLREQVNEARGMPSKEALVRRLNFCQWVDAATAAISREAWEACEDKRFKRDGLKGRRCWGGLDLSSVLDLTAFALLFEPSEDDKRWRLVVWFWIPGEDLAEREDRDKVPYRVWRDHGHLETTPGKTVDKNAVAMRVVEICAGYDVQEIGFDRWRIADFKRELEKEGEELPLVEFGQGFKDMAPAVDEFERLLVGRKMRHDGNPVLTWNAANAVYETDAAKNRKLSKDKATGRIDGIVAAVMAAGRAIQLGEDQEIAVPFVEL